MNKDALENVLTWVTFGAGAVGAWLGYRSAPEHRWGAAIIGFAITAFFGMNLIYVIAPKAGVSFIKRRAGDDRAHRATPISGIILALLIYFFFRDVLGNPAVWHPVLIVGSVIGLLGLLKVITAGD
jgi:UDP-N-acetylmuramyl pentapeptide phosphotransferase/UDP-N-acetylglucosamine-1-phosphate transferase